MNSEIRNSDFAVRLFFVLNSIYYLRAGLLLSDSFELSLLLAGALALLSLLSLFLEELTLGVDCLDDPEDSTLLWLCAGLEAALSVFVGGVLRVVASGLWLCAGLDGALSVVEAGALLVAASVLWLCEGLDLARSVEISAALRVVLAFCPAEGIVRDLLAGVSAGRRAASVLEPAGVRSLVVPDTDLLSWLRLIVLSAVLLVCPGCSFVKRASPSFLCSGRE